MPGDVVASVPLGSVRARLDGWMDDRCTKLAPNSQRPRATQATQAGEIADFLLMALTNSSKYDLDEFIRYVAFLMHWAELIMRRPKPGSSSTPASTSIIIFDMSGCACAGHGHSVAAVHILWVRARTSVRHCCAEKREWPPLNHAVQGSSGIFAT